MNAIQRYETFELSPPFTEKLHIAFEALFSRFKALRAKVRHDTAETIIYASVAPSMRSSVQSVGPVLWLLSWLKYIRPESSVR